MNAKPLIAPSQNISSLQTTEPEYPAPQIVARHALQQDWTAEYKSHGVGRSTSPMVPRCEDQHHVERVGEWGRVGIAEVSR